MTLKYNLCNNLECSDMMDYYCSYVLPVKGRNVNTALIKSTRTFGGSNSPD